MNVVFSNPAFRLHFRQTAAILLGMRRRSPQNAFTPLCCDKKPLQCRTILPVSADSHTVFFRVVLIPDCTPLLMAITELRTPTQWFPDPTMSGQLSSEGFIIDMPLSACRRRPPTLTRTEIGRRLFTQIINRWRPPASVPAPCC